MSFSDNFQIRRAKGSDLPIIRSVLVAAYEKYLTRMDRKPAPLLDDYEKQIGAGTLWVIGSPIIGLIALVRDSNDSLLIENVAVHPSAQGKGIGRRLMEFAEEEARRQGVYKLELYTNEAMVENIAIYAHLGYVEVGRRTEDGYNRVYMQKELTSV